MNSLAVTEHAEDNFIYFLKSAWVQNMAWKGCASPKSVSSVTLSCSPKCSSASSSPVPLCSVSPQSCSSTSSMSTMTGTSTVTRSAIHHRLDDALSHEGNTSTMAAERRTHILCNYYKSLETDEKAMFLRTLARDYNIDHNNLLNLTKNMETIFERGDAVTLMTEERLRHALTPRYQKLFCQIGRLDEGVKFLVDLRADVLAMLMSRSTDQSDPHLKAINTSLRELIGLWFSVGFLTLERITWEKSSCEMLQKISEYEAVHPIRNWPDLRRRVGPYRRCFVFAHHSMPREPIVVLHTALTEDISDNIQSIVQNPLANPTADSQVDLAHTKQNGTEDPNKISTAIFYSITSTQRGLQGIETGNYLIKQVVKELQAEFPRMNKFSSLSPIPGFKDWFLGELHKNQNAREIGELPENELFTDSEISDLCDALACTEKLLPDLLKKYISNNSWATNERLTAVLKEPLMRLCARYLYLEKRRGTALNPVANFHLRNGAVMWRLNWLADRSPRGLGASCGMMVNYRYYLDQTELNSRNYIERGVIEASDQIKLLTSNISVSPHSSTSSSDKTSS